MCLYNVLYNIIINVMYVFYNDCACECICTVFN